MSKFILNKRTGKLIEYPPYKCKMCGIGDIEFEFDVCHVCGWEDDGVQNNDPDYEGGANHMSLNQYSKFWEENKEVILKSKDRCFTAIQLAKEYYRKLFGEIKIRKNPINMIKEESLSEYEEEKHLKKQKLVRSEFKTVSKYGIPLIKKQNIDLDKIDLWGFTKTKENDEENKDKTIHFFTYDWNFDSVYDKPEIAMEKLDQYYALLSPEFSLYWDMPKALQIYSTFKNRWCGAYWQKHGKIVIPTICCAGEDSYDFCFDGIEEGSVVAISTYRREKYKKEIMRDYNKMLEVIKPSAIICYGEPFSEMKGNIKAISPFNKEELIAQMGFR